LHIIFTLLRNQGAARVRLANNAEQSENWQCSLKKAAGFCRTVSIEAFAAKHLFGRKSTERLIALIKPQVLYLYYTRCNTKLCSKIKYNFPQFRSPHSNCPGFRVLLRAAQLRILSIVLRAADPFRTYGVAGAETADSSKQEKQIELEPLDCTCRKRQKKPLIRAFRFCAMCAARMFRVD
jgi:hypothetical protein